MPLENINLERDDPLLFYANIAASGLSLMSSLFMVYLTLKRSLKSSSLHLITYIFLSDLFYSVSNLLSVSKLDEAFLCQAQAFMGQYFFLMSMLLSSSVALMSYFTLRSLDSRFDSRMFVYKAVLVCGSYCFTCALLPFFFQKFVIYQKHALFCSIAVSEDESLFHKLVVLLIFQGIPLIAGLLITLISYYKTVASIRRTLGSVFISTRFNAYKIFWYPAVTLLVFAPHVVYNFENIFIRKTSIWIEVVHILMTNSVGFFNALVYGSLYLKGRNTRSMHNEAEYLPSRNMNNIYQPLRSSPPRERGGQVIRQLFEEPEPPREDDQNFIPESQPSTNRSFNSMGYSSEE